MHHICYIHTYHHICTFILRPFGPTSFWKFLWAAESLVSRHCSWLEHRGLPSVRSAGAWLRLEGGPGGSGGHECPWKKPGEGIHTRCKKKTNNIVGVRSNQLSFGVKHFKSAVFHYVFSSCKCTSHPSSPSYYIHLFICINHTEVEPFPLLCRTFVFFRSTDQVRTRVTVGRAVWRPRPQPVAQLAASFSGRSTLL